LKFKLNKTSKREIKNTLSHWESDTRVNSILEDLRYVDEIYLEEIRQDKLLRKEYVMRQLWSVSNAIDSSYMQFNKAYAIDMLVETCHNNVKD
jgi:hypothetical protein